MSTIEDLYNSLFLTDQEKTIIGRTHVDWWGYALDVFKDGFVSYLLVFLFITGLLVFLFLSMEEDKGKGPNPKPVNKERAFMLGLIAGVAMSGLFTAGHVYQEVHDVQRIVAKPYHPKHKRLHENLPKLEKHGFNQDFIEITNRVEEYDLATAPMKTSRTGKDGVVCEKPSSCSFDDSSAYLLEIITGYGDNHEPTTKKKLYLYDSLYPSQVSINYVKSNEQKQPHIKINYEKVEDTRFRGIPDAVDGDEDFISNELECLSSCIIKSGEEAKKIEITVYVDDVD
jgi:hypothetical protein